MSVCACVCVCVCVTCVGLFFPELVLLGPGSWILGGSDAKEKGFKCAKGTRKACSPSLPALHYQDRSEASCIPSGPAEA